MNGSMRLPAAMARITLRTGNESWSWITFMPELWFVDFLKNLKKKKLTPKA